MAPSQKPVPLPPSGNDTWPGALSSGIGRGTDLSIHFQLGKVRVVESVKGYEPTWHVVSSQPPPGLGLQLIRVKARLA